MQDDFESLQVAMKEYPDKIKKLLESNMEMKSDTTPDRTADYYEEKNDINQWIEHLKLQEQNF